MMKSLISRRFLVIWGCLLVSTLQIAYGSVEYARLCDSVFCRILEQSHTQIRSLKQIIDADALIPAYGAKADEICNLAVEAFTADAPLPDDSPDNEAVYDRKVEELEKALDAPLQVLYMKQLVLLKEKCLKLFKASSEGTEFEAMMNADETFRQQASEATRRSPDWSYAKESSLLKAALLEAAKRGKKVQELKASAGKSNQNTVQFIQQLQQQIQAIQASQAPTPWQGSLAYRIPDSNFHLSASYSGGRASLQLACVPDESNPHLGPNGFTNGIDPGNVGLSFNVNI